MKKLDNGKNRLIFSQRDMITDEAEEWCENNRVSPNTFNIVTALSVLGYLNVEEIRKQYHKKNDNKFSPEVILLEDRMEQEFDKPVEKRISPNLDFS